jgi:hypothetical protein
MRRTGYACRTELEKLEHSDTTSVFTVVSAMQQALPGVADLFFFRVPMPLQVELAELGTGLGVVGFDSPLLAPSSAGRTVCLEELLDVSLGSDVTVGDDCMRGGVSLEPMPVPALVCEEAATTALLLHMQRHVTLMEFMHIL